MDGIHVKMREDKKRKLERVEAGQRKEFQS